LFKVVGISAKGDVEVFSDHDAGFYGVVVVEIFDDGVDLLVVVFVVLDGDELCGPAEVVFYCGEVCFDRGADVGVVVVLWGEDDEEVWVVFLGGNLDGHCLLGVGGDEGELTDEQKGKDAKDDPAGFVCHGSFHHR